MAYHFVAELLFVPSCFHFVIIPLTVGRGIFSSKEISRIDFLPILSEMFVEAVC
ncbi:unnamed protein product, partial [Staurois parvus]